MDVRLHEVDTAGLVAQKKAAPSSLAELGFRSSRLMGGMALTTEKNDPVARERNARDANPDNPHILTCLRDAGVPVHSYKDFRQLETQVRVPRSQAGYRDLLEFASSHIQKIGQEHRIDTTRGIAGGFQISLITDAQCDRIFGFLGHNDAGERIFLSRDGETARVWYG